MEYHRKYEYRGVELETLECPDVDGQIHYFIRVDGTVLPRCYDSVNRACEIGQKLVDKLIEDGVVE